MDLIRGRLDVSIPIRPAWLILSVILRKKFQVVSLSKCLEISKALHMDEEEVMSALWYLHHIVGSLMHYPNIDSWFDENVICSPQVIFDSISQIIVASMRVLHSDTPVRECFRRDWIERGLLSIEAIEEASRTIQHQSFIPTDKLVKLLEHVNLLSQVKVQDPLPGTPSVRLFMPAILEFSTEQELGSPPQTDSDHPAPMFLVFKCGYVPTGVFCGLVTRIVSQGPLNIFGEKWELKNDHVKRNKVSFLVGGLNLVTLISHDTHYEIRIERRATSTSLSNLCSQVLTTILYILREGYNRLELNIAFECPCDNQDQKHMCKVSEVAICQFEGGPREVQLRNEQKEWIGLVGINFCASSYIVV